MKKLSMIILITALVCILCACSTGEDPGSIADTAVVYDLSEDLSHLEAASVDMDISSGELTDRVRMLLQRLIDGPDGNRHRAAVPVEITSVTYILGPQTVVVDLGNSFNELPVIKKVMCEAAVVQTLCQLEEVFSVGFSAGGLPVCDTRGEPVGMLTADSFVENDGAMINAYEKAELHLYFADESGKRLTEKVENVTYNSNIPLDRLVVDHIVSGPSATDVYATVNPATSVISVSTLDGICYVNLSDDFLIKTTNVSDEVMVYSIVNSLSDLDNVNKVQILIEGNNGSGLAEIDISGVLERNLELVNK